MSIISSSLKTIILTSYYTFKKASAIENTKEIKSTACLKHSNNNMLEAAQLQIRQRTRYRLSPTLTTGYSDTENVVRRHSALPHILV